MSRQSRRARRSQSKKTALLPMLLVAGVVGLVGISLYLVQVVGSPSCKKGGSHTVTAVIIDTSDPFAPHQIKAFNTFAKTLIEPPEPEETVTANSDSKNYVQRGDLLVAYEIADESGQPRKLFERCMPGNPKEGGIFGWTKYLKEPKPVVMARWLEFTQELAAAFEEEKFITSAPTSPIIETIRYVRRDQFPSSSELKASGERSGTIFIISDMLQNSDQLSHFDSELPAVEGVPASFALDLTGIDIGIRYLKSNQYKHLQQGARPHFTWWRKFFAIAGSPLRLPPEAW